MIINHHFVLHCFDSLWHYGLGPSSPPPPPPPPPPAAAQIISFSSVTSLPSTNTSTDRESAQSLPLLLTHAHTRPAGSLPRLFNVLDEDGDGRLSLCDMCSLVAKLGMSSDADNLLSLIRSTLQHQQIMSGTRQEYLPSLDFPQFAQLYASLFAAPPQPDRLTENPAHQDAADDHSIDIHDDDELLDAFQVYDTNRDGFITAAELAAVLLDLGLLRAGDQHGNIDAHNLGKCQAYIDSVDLDGNGMVDLQEFKAMMNMHNNTTLTF